LQGAKIGAQTGRFSEGAGKFKPKINNILPMIRHIETYGFGNSSEATFPFKFETLEHRNNYDSSELHRHDYYEVFLFTHGSGSHVLDFSEIPIEDNSIHFLTPGMVHCVQRGLKSDGYVMMFTDDFYYFNAESKNLLFELPFFHNNSPQTAFTLQAGEFSELSRLAEDIRDIYHSNHPYRLNILQSYLHIFLLRCRYAAESTHVTMPKDHGTSSLLHKFKKLLEKDFLKYHQVKYYASVMNITPNHLNNICKQNAGKTASDLIQERLILEAKRLLIYSMKSAKEISFELNFDSPSHFNKFFKNKTTETPAGFVRTYDFVNRMAV
jgi:AraC family transcriptional activator of pobA